MPFKFVDDIATADCAVEITADSLPEVFRNAGESLIAIMTDPATVGADKSWTIELQEETLERLFYSWLAELVFIKDSENVLFSKFLIEDLETKHLFRMRARIEGESINQERHDISVDVKAVTMHMFKIEHNGSSWNAFLIFDL